MRSLLDLLEYQQYAGYYLELSSVVVLEDKEDQVYFNDKGNNGLLISNDEIIFTNNVRLAYSKRYKKTPTNARYCLGLLDISERTSFPKMRTVASLVGLSFQGPSPGYHLEGYTKGSHIYVGQNDLLSPPRISLYGIGEYVRDYASVEEAQNAGLFYALKQGGYEAIADKGLLGWLYHYHIALPIVELFYGDPAKNKQMEAETFRRLIVSGEII